MEKIDGFKELKAHPNFKSRKGDMKKDPKVKQAESEMVVVKKSGLARTKTLAKEKDKLQKLDKTSAAMVKKANADADALVEKARKDGVAIQAKADKKAAAIVEKAQKALEKAQAKAKEVSGSVGEKNAALIVSAQEQAVAMKNKAAVDAKEMKANVTRDHAAASQAVASHASDVKTMEQTLLRAARKSLDYLGDPVHGSYGERAHVRTFGCSSSTCSLKLGTGTVPETRARPSKACFCCFGQ